MTRAALLAPLALAALAATLAILPAAAALDASPVEAGASCIGKTQVAAICMHDHGLHDCYHVWILGQERPEMEFC